MIESLLLVLAAVYGASMIAIAVAVSRRDNPAAGVYTPEVTIIVAARNEERNIEACIDSLLQVHYPQDRLEIVIVDDNSTDNTYRILREYSDRVFNLTSFQAPKPGVGLNGKANALSHGVRHSRGEILLFTDADCVVPQTWVEKMVARFSDPAVGIVAGFTILEGRTIFAKIQTVDWIALFTVAAGALRLGFPVTAVGNNLAVRRSAYFNVGGYEGTKSSPTEDQALFEAVTVKAGYAALFPLDYSIAVTSLPCSSPVDLFKQKQRWFLGGREMEWKRLMLFAIPYGFHIALVLAAFTCSWGVLAFGLLVKLASDAVALWPALRVLNRKSLLPLVPLFELYFLLYVLVFPPIVALGGSVRWKGREV